MSYEAYQDAVEHAATNIRRFWAELKSENVNVFYLHKMGIRVTVQIKEARRMMKSAIEDHKDRSLQKIFYLYSQFNLCVLDNELEALRCY